MPALRNNTTGATIVLPSTSGYAIGGGAGEWTVIPDPSASAPIGAQSYNSGTNTWDLDLVLMSEILAQGIVAASAMMATYEAYIGYPARRSGTFTIPATGLMIGKPVAIWLAPGPYAGKGGANSFDEAQMYDIGVSARCMTATSIRAWWQSRHRVGGVVKFNLQIGE